MEREMDMLSFIDDLAGAVYDVFKMLLKGFCYFMAGVLLVSIPMYVLVWVFGLISDWFY